ncbi:hypothetical protein Agabi119p4_11536 [Agaricus bisporus var. burnettii]|uniref:Uncharacterized protein n=1 Tax=Agaricus bisporus var. burnettii TaxID=192524 RepID=A0A8H7BZK9_AGABI|nr:hypothetical protein Agabi119p4_11536 [Agaricus bisporus var. burnettii]
MEKMIYYFHPNDSDYFLGRCDEPATMSMLDFLHQAGLPLPNAEGQDILVLKPPGLSFLPCSTMRRHVKDWLRQNATNAEYHLNPNSKIQECFPLTSEEKQETFLDIITKFSDGHMNPVNSTKYSDPILYESKRGTMNRSILATYKGMKRTHRFDMTLMDRAYERMGILEDY